MIFAGWRPTAERLVWLVGAIAFSACASTRTPPTNIPVNLSAMDAAQAAPFTPTKPVPRMSGEHEPDRVQLNPNNLVLPEATADAPEAVRDFIAAASHAVRQAYEQDNDDPSVLLALQESLRDRAELKTLVPVWREILQTALARTESLLAVGPVLRPLREAMRTATLEASSQTIQGMDVALCQKALTSPIGRNTAIDGIVATFAHVGTFNLGQVREACTLSARTALEKIHLPGRAAPPRIRRLVRKLYAQAHMGGDVRKVVVIRPWHRDKARHALTMQAAIGIGEGPSDGEQACTMARIAVIRSLRGNSLPALVELGTREPILCSQLR